MKQTAVEWLEANIDDLKLSINDGYKLIKLLKQAKAMEKGQIIEAWDNGYSNGYDLGKHNDDCNPDDSEQYYDETFKSK